MAAVILGWNADRWDRWNYRAVVEQVLESGRFPDRWDVGPNWSIQPETEAWLLFQGTSEAGTGLIGHGVVLSETLEAEHLPDAGSGGRYAAVVFDALLPLGEQIRSDVLIEAVPGIPWVDALHRPVVSVPPSAEPGLRQLWRDLGPAAIEPTELVPGTYPLNAISSIVVNRYERDPDARRVCLAFHGTQCAACGFSFEASYGDIGEGFIHIHHTVPASLLASGYELDPVADLVPLCANCHAMAHRGVSTARTVTELRNIISGAGHLRGEMVSEQALEAQENARRIIEGHHD
ncbi:HNH endonuclease [Pseudarthrobacter sp. NS4]|uniref:HNH endonuclease n=1 Tax=Pseudarthrobacter sp. NS4 TaxID=2973976 RepID=UPI002161BC26|nr:HNH endonuclease [Pseudarthrobacter sp. NS4]